MRSGTRFRGLYAVIDALFAAAGALADLLELDDTVKATIAHLEEVRQLDCTVV